MRNVYFLRSEHSSVTIAAHFIVCPEEHCFIVYEFFTRFVYKNNSVTFSLCTNRSHHCLFSINSNIEVELSRHHMRLPCNLSQK